MQDKEVDWKIVRGIWNKTQIEYVNGYQKKIPKRTQTRKKNKIRNKRIFGQQ